MNSGAQTRQLPKGPPSRSKTFRFKSLLQSTEWLSPAYVTVDDRGIITQISQAPGEGINEIDEVNGYALPGFQNAHSHAFQFMMAGAAEKHAAHAVDDFWTWRQTMYACALAVDPDQMQAIATMLYTEMLKRGYTHVAEFQYLHHDKDGRPYDHAAEMSVSLVAAAAVAGIKITLIPVFYQNGGFGRPATPEQRRFCFGDVDEYFRLLDECGQVVKSLSTARLGFGVHSLRAAEANDVVRIVQNGPRDLPFHIHVAEQPKEVDDAIAFLGHRPVEWLLRHVDLSDRFHLVHCTHLSDDELTGLVKSKAQVVLCPGTEANLGDGIFRLSDFAQRGGHWSIGTDSQVSMNPLEDLRWLDYAQRLTSHKRNTFADGAVTLLHNITFSGRKAMGISSQDYFETGKPLDAVVFDADTPLLHLMEPDDILPALVYTADSVAIKGTIVDGEWMVKEKSHKHEAIVREKFLSAIRTVTSS